MKTIQLSLAVTVMLEEEAKGGEGEEGLKAEVLVNLAGHTDVFSEFPVRVNRVAHSR